MPPNVDILSQEEIESAPYDLKSLARQYNHKYVAFSAEKLEPLQPFEHKDPARLGDPKKASLFEKATKVFDLTPHIGTEIHGIQLSELTDQQKNDLALLAAERGVVFFRNQNITPAQGLELGRYFGRLHIHPTGGHPPGLPEILSVVYDGQDERTRENFNQRQAADGWHTDITFEEQPAGLEFLKIDVLPPSGGDTLWISGYEAYDRLSPALQKFLEGLEAVHSGDVLRAGAIATGRPIRREFVENVVHPVIRTHPVTGWKALFVQPGFTRRIVGLSKRESDALLQLLFSHIAGGHDFQVRFKWEEDSVAVWDNRATAHSAIFDYFDVGRRHGWRVTPTAERPFFDPNSKSRREALAEKKA